MSNHSTGGNESLKTSSYCIYYHTFYTMLQVLFFRICTQIKISTDQGTPTKTRCTMLLMLLPLNVRSYDSSCHPVHTHTQLDNGFLFSQQLVQLHSNIQMSCYQNPPEGVNKHINALPLSWYSNVKMSNQIHLHLSECFDILNITRTKCSILR